MKKKTLFNIKGAGRKAIHDRGVRHIARDLIKHETKLHLTIKIDKSKAGIKNKHVLRLLHASIKKARVIGLRVLHYTLEYDHVHMLVEADSNALLGKGMQSFGISFSKGINKLKGMKGQVYKTRYHFRKLTSRREVKNVLNYIFGNSIKHKSHSSAISPYNSFVAIKDFSRLYPGFELGIESVIENSKFLQSLRKELLSTLSPPRRSIV